MEEQVDKERLIRLRQEGAVRVCTSIGADALVGTQHDNVQYITDLRRFFEGCGYQPHFVEGTEPAVVHEALASTLDECHATIREIWDGARTGGRAVTRPRWPAIVLRTLKGWTCPREVDGQQVEGTFRAHQVPISGVRDNAAHLELLEQWMRSYRPDELFDENGTLVDDLRPAIPRRARPGHRQPRRWCE